MLVRWVRRRSLRDIASARMNLTVRTHVALLAQANSVAGVRWQGGSEGERGGGQERARKARACASTYQPQCRLGCARAKPARPRIRIQAPTLISYAFHPLSDRIAYTRALCGITAACQPATDTWGENHNRQRRNKGHSAQDAPVCPQWSRASRSSAVGLLFKKDQHLRMLLAQSSPL